MFLKKSIRRSFLIQLFFASASLIFIFSSILYIYIEKSIYDEKQAELIQFAKNIANNKSIFQMDSITPDTFLGLNVEIVQLKQTNNKMRLSRITENEQTYLILLYPYNLDNLNYLKITRQVTHTKILLDKILNYIFIINIASFILVLLYAIALSKTLSTPIENLNTRLSDMNEHLMKPIKVEELPEEFLQLGATLNHLITRIQNFVKYQKELFIGTAHELKTPLAVIKLKNQVTLIKKRTPEEYIEALETTNKAVDEMNIIVSNILNIGRQEGAHLDKPIKINVVSILKEKANDFKLLAESEKKNLITDFKIHDFTTTIQVSLFTQIIQNFLQNALKFTPEGKTVIIRNSLKEDELLIEIVDEGCGIDESLDLFAPFKRQGNKSGVGLGLFLAKSAADALNAKIELNNRKDETHGTIASLKLYSKQS